MTTTKTFKLEIHTDDDSLAADTIRAVRTIDNDPNHNKKKLIAAALLAAGAAYAAKDALKYQKVIDTVMSKEDKILTLMHGASIPLALGGLYYANKATTKKERDIAHLAAGVGAGYAAFGPIPDSALQPAHPIVQQKAIQATIAAPVLVGSALYASHKANDVAKETGGRVYADPVDRHFDKSALKEHLQSIPLDIINALRKI